jgi:phosphoribosyl 1,2-cyclic phosphate phosphodiesterase
MMINPIFLKLVLIMKITVLGSGTSQGVPVIGCSCAVCQSTNPKDNRLRASILINHNGENYCIDSGPDFRQQMLREGVKSLRAILFTHEHKDHIAGMDDVRAFNYLENRPMEVYCTVRVEEALRREFHYVFLRDGYPGIPQVELNRIDSSTPFDLPGGLMVIPIEVMHYKLPVLGFRFGDFAYITDAKTITQEEKDKLIGVKILMINALRIEPHLSHFNLEEAIAFIREVKPEKAYLTHISHLFGAHDEINNMLPDDIFVAYDGMEIYVE